MSRACRSLRIRIGMRTSCGRARSARSLLVSGPCCPPLVLRLVCGGALDVRTPVARQASALACGAGAGEGNAADRIDALDRVNEGLEFTLRNAAFLERRPVMVDFLGFHHHPSVTV